MSAQFFSSLADNALFVAADRAASKSAGAPEWQRAALVPMFALFYVVLAPFVGAFADAVPKGKVMFYLERHQGGRLPDDAVRRPSADLLRRRRPRRGGLLAGQVRHPHRAAADLAAGQGQRLDRGPDHHVHHPRRAARRPAGRPASRRTCWPSTCRSSTPASTPRPRRRSPDGGALRHRRAVQPAHPAHRRAAAAAGARHRASWCATSPTATRACGTTSSARSRWPRRRCSGASPATCATSCWPGPRVALGYSTTQASSLVGVVAIGTAAGAVVASMCDAARPGDRVIPLGIVHGRAGDRR